MKLIIIVSIGLLSVVQSVPTNYRNLTEIDTTMMPFILHGDIVDRTSIDFPYYVSVHFVEECEVPEFYCGGAILGPSVIISAAHCFVNKDTDKILIRPNYDNTIDFLLALDLPMSLIYYQVESILCRHQPGLVDDICLVFLQKPIPYSHHVQPIKLPEQRYPAGTELTVIGCGRTELSSRSAHLRKANIIIRSNVICEREYVRFSRETQFCAIGYGNADASKGDSGGPAVFVNPDKSHVLVGIVSYKKADWQPGVCVNVWHYIDWIKENSRIF